MVSTVLSPSAAFLLNAFEQVGFNPSAGLSCGISNVRGEIESIRAASNPDACTYFFEEMREAADSLVHPSDAVLERLEEGEGPIDISRRWYLDTYSTMGQWIGETRKDLAILGAGQYRHFAPIKCVEDGRKVRLQFLRNNGSPFELGLECLLIGPEAALRQRETLGLNRLARQWNTVEVSIRVAKMDLLKRLVGLEDGANVGPALGEALDMAMQLSAGIHHFTLSSGESLLMGWDVNGFLIQQTRGVGGPPPVPGVTRIFEWLRMEIERGKEEFDGLPYFDRIGELAEWYASVKNEPRGQS